MPQTPRKVRRARSALIGAVIATMTLIGVAAPANAGTNIVKWYSTQSACTAAMPTYISSWTKIVQSCTYYDARWFFVYTTR